MKKHSIFFIFILFLVISSAQASVVSVSCPANNWCYLAMNYSSKTLLNLSNSFLNSTTQGHYNSSTHLNEGHRTGYRFNENITVNQKWGYYSFFNSSQIVNVTIDSIPEITLPLGWNLVGNYNTSNRTLAELKASIGANVTQIQYWNASAWRFATALQSTTVPAGQSFFVYVNHTTLWSN